VKRLPWQLENRIRHKVGGTNLVTRLGAAKWLSEQGMQCFGLDPYLSELDQVLRDIGLEACSWFGQIVNCSCSHDPCENETWLEFRGLSGVCIAQYSGGEFDLLGLPSPDEPVRPIRPDMDTN
jgi:hypothetical protein